MDTKTILTILIISLIHKGFYTSRQIHQRGVSTYRSRRNKTNSRRSRSIYSGYSQYNRKRNHSYSKGFSNLFGSKPVPTDNKNKSVKNSGKKLPNRSNRQAEGKKPKRNSFSRGFANSYSRNKTNPSKGRHFGSSFGRSFGRS